MTGTRRDSGRKGGTTTLERYGRDQLAEWGKLGGRPRNDISSNIRPEHGTQTIKGEGSATSR